GATTPSYDLEKPIDKEYPLDGVSEESVRAILPSFLGEQDQIAPLFSAKSVDGERMYEKARKLWKQGLPVDAEGILQANRITIYDINLVEFGPAPAQNAVDDGRGRIRVADISGHNLPTAIIDAECSKGTYIRALARDLGEALGSGAFLSSLRRTGNGGYSIEDAIPLPDALQLLSE
ncbi:MAG: hypothetical protein K5909_05710, partial [Bacteroidales bacterium]|nr:hypothetical protein [Bacteroidales bacterium]